jgi:hypothetical protein
MKLLEFLIGKKVSVETDVGDIILEVSSIEEKKYSEEIGPSNQANDWWPETREWVTYLVKFTNGKSKEYRSLNSINIIV